MLGWEKMVFAVGGYSELLAVCTGSVDTEITRASGGDPRSLGKGIKH